MSPPRSPITGRLDETSFVTRIGPAELAASSHDCPWFVRARHGQRLNLTVHFAPPRGGDEFGRPLCGMVLDVVDGGNLTTTLKPPCALADRHRERQTYSSVSNELKVYVRSTGGATYVVAADTHEDDDDDDDDDLSSTPSPGFLLHYHGVNHQYLIPCINLLPVVVRPFSQSFRPDPRRPRTRS